ncbi:MAG: GNAT family N-acetyltransferase [bacterium]
MIHITRCDFNNKIHQLEFVKLLGCYMEDSMGLGEKVDEKKRISAFQGLSEIPTAFVLFAINEDNYIGMATCFYSFSTFHAKNLINIHDIIILPDYRGKGVGKKLMQEIIKMAKNNNCIKVTLEVRHDNNRAKSLYRSLGFSDTTPPMYFWEKKLL